MALEPADLIRLATDPRYRRLLRRRGRFGWTLTATMLFVYLGYILLVAFAKPLLALPLAEGATSIGIPLGLAVILCAIGLTGLYVRQANREFDHEVDALTREYGD